MTQLSSGHRELAKLMPRHKKILDLKLIGLEVKDIAKSMGLSSSHVNMVCSSPVFQDEMARRRAHMDKDVDQAGQLALEEARRHLDRASLKAVRVQEELLEEDDARVRQKAVSEILDRTFSPTGVVNGGPNGGGPQAVVVLQGAAVENLTVAISEGKEDCLPGNGNLLD